MEKQQTEVKKINGKKPMWQWILIGVIIIAIIAGLIYYLVARNNNGYGSPSAKTTITTTNTSTATSSNIYQQKTNSSVGTYITDFQGMTLYISSADSSGTSNCTGSCATTWPPYTSGAVAESMLPTNIAVITRSDGSKQFTWKGMPLYYYAGDVKAGDINGNGLGGFSVAK